MNPEHGVQRVEGVIELVALLVVHRAACPIGEDLSARGSQLGDGVLCFPGSLFHVIQGQGRHKGGKLIRVFLRQRIEAFVGEPGQFGGVLRGDYLLHIGADNTGHLLVALKLRHFFQTVLQVTHCLHISCPREHMGASAESQDPVVELRRKIMVKHIHHSWHS